MFGKARLAVTVAILAVAASLYFLWPAIDKQVAFRLMPAPHRNCAAIESSWANVPVADPHDMFSGLGAFPRAWADECARAEAANAFTTATTHVVWVKALRLEVWVVAFALIGFVFVSGRKQITHTQ